MNELPTCDSTVGVVGASARAAAMSLARAGYSAWAVDLFTDRDLKRIAPCVRCSFADFPEALPQLAERFPPGPMFYTGGLENYPDVVRELARRRPLWGNGPEVLAQVRDPFELAVVVKTPVACASGSPVPTTGEWLVKSLRSSGGLGVRWARPGEIVPTGCYLQEFISGTPMSAVFHGKHLLGVTEQLIGTTWLHSRPFHYAGTIAPIALPLEVTSELSLLGEQLVEAFGLTGLFGVDFILKDGEPWVLEVNPRYPASAEVLEHAGGFAAFNPLASRERKRPEFSTVAKGIYFAPRELRFPEAGPWDADLTGPFDPWRLPGFADIPEPGEPIEASSPVLTFFAEGTTVAECRKLLQTQAGQLDELLLAILTRKPAPIDEGVRS